MAAEWCFFRAVARCVSWLDKYLSACSWTGGVDAGVVRARAQVTVLASRLDGVNDDWLDKLQRMSVQTKADEFGNVDSVVVQSEHMSAGHF